MPNKLPNIPPLPNPAAFNAANVPANIIAVCAPLSNRYFPANIPAIAVPVSAGTLAKPATRPPTPFINPCVASANRPSAGPNAANNPVSIIWNCPDNLLVASWNVVKPCVSAVDVSPCSANTAFKSRFVVANLITPFCNLKNSTVPVTVAFLNLSCEAMD